MAPKQRGTKHDDTESTKDGSCVTFKKLIAIRSGSRICIGKLERQAMTLTEELVNERGESVHSLIRLKSCQKALTGKQTYVNELNEKILQIYTDDIIEKEIDETAEWNLFD